jgi:sulfate/thiosulfate transport system substrate-binding protein
MIRWMLTLLLCSVGTGVLTGCGGRGDAEFELINVSYDPTRELYQAINAAFTADYFARTGRKVAVTQSHGGSSSQARAVIDGLRADVVTLALAGDIDAIRKKGLIAEKWQDRLPDNSCPYTSTIVLVVRQGNPKGIKDWSDLVRPDVRVITPNPKTSGGARWNFLAAWGFNTVHQKKSNAEALSFVRRLYASVPKLDTGARGSTDTFLKRKLGDVLIAWENEAILARREAAQEGLEIVYPSASILAEPPVAVVDQWTAERGTREVAEAYLKFLYTDAAQEIIAKKGYRPRSATVLQRHAAQLPALKLYSLQEVAGDWEQAQAKFFADGGVFDQVYQAKGAR